VLTGGTWPSALGLTHGLKPAAINLAQRKSRKYQRQIQRSRFQIIEIQLQITQRFSRLTRNVDQSIGREKMQKNAKNN
jgi:hypothetical protein